MAILKVCQMGHPVLRVPARLLSKEEIQGKVIKELIQDMWDTLDEYRGVGLAAPQVYQSINLALIGTRKSKSRYEEDDVIEPKVIINATYRGVGEELQGIYEGCLSIPGIRAHVPRYQQIEVEYLDEHGQEHKDLVEDFEAIVFQHEIDHLQGILFLDRCDHETLTFEAEFERFHSDD